MKDKLLKLVKNKKALIVAGVVLLCIILILAIYFIFIKGNNEPSLQETIDGRVLAYETDLRDSLETLDSNDAVVKYLVNWGKNKNIDAKADYHNNVVFNIPATAAANEQKPTVIVCGYNADCMESYIHSIVCALTVAKTTTEHGDLKIIFVSENPDDSGNVEKISSKYFSDNTQAFYLGNTNNSKIGIATGGFNKYTISKNYKEVRPSNNKAYKISISGLPEQMMDSKSVKTPNPIKRLGNLLATFKSNSIIFELASFEGGKDASVTPGNASMTIVVNNDATTKLENQLNKAIEKFNDSYSEKYPDAAFTFEVCDLPSRVVNSDDTEHLVSLMYTLLNGEYSVDEEDDDYITSYSNIGYISIKARKITILTAASSYDSSKLSEITESYKTISALSNIGFKVSSSKAVFAANDAGKELAKNFIVSYKKYKTTELEKKNVPEYTPCYYLSKLNEKAGLIYLGVTEKTQDNFAGGLIVHMQP
ncbi:MAG: hypothetical protein IJP00_06870 [Firmicutes bacterium]|nr:hypothetical protein [Bacillota bacterium]